MPLQPTPGTIVIVQVGAPTDAEVLNPFRAAPIRPVENTDYMLVLDAAGEPARVPWSTITPPAPEIPDNAFVDESGSYFTDEFGAYFTA